MSANYRQHQAERDLQRRVTALEARVAWLEDVLSRVVGQPAVSRKPAADDTPLPEIGQPGALDRFMLRTQPLAALNLASVHGELETLPSANDDASPTAAAVAPVPIAITPPARPAVAAVAITPPAVSLDTFTLDEGGSLMPEAIPRNADGVFAEDHFIPAPAPAASAAAKPAAVSLGITAAFETLEGKVAQAADDELASVRKRGPAAPAIAIRPELINTQRQAQRTLEVCSALELLNPSILQQVMVMWGKAECAPRLMRLIGEDFGGRMGLDPHVREELQLLIAISGMRPQA